jgi:hypothetical protein
LAVDPCNSTGNKEEMETWLAIPKDRRPSRSLPLCVLLAMLFLTLIYSYGQSRPADGAQPMAPAKE